MFGSKSSGKNISKEFAVIRNTNINFISQYKLAIEHLKLLESKEDYDKKHIVNTSMWDKLNNKKDDINYVYDNLGYQIKTIIETFEEFIKVREEENSEISKYFQNTTKEFVETYRSLNQILIRFNQKKIELNNKLTAIFPDIIKDSNDIIGIEDTIIEDSAKNYVKFLQEFVELLNSENENEKGIIFSNFVLTLIYLEKYSGDVTTLRKVEANSFVDSINGRSFGKFAKQFAKNYKIRGSALMNEILNHINTEKVEGNNYYLAVKEDSRVKIDKLAKYWILSLVGNCSYKSGSEKINTKEDWEALINKIFKVASNMKELKESWEKTVRPNLETAIHMSNYQFRSSSGGFNGLKIINKDGSEITISDFENLFKDDKNKTSIEYILRYFEDILTKPKEKPFKEFINVNSALFVEIGTSLTASDEDEIWSSSEIIVDSNLELVFDEGITNISNQIEGLRLILDNEDNFERGILKKLVSDSIKDMRDEIVSILKVFGKNLNSYSSKKMWDSTKLEIIKDDIKNLIRKLNLISNKSSIELSINDLTSLLGKLS